MQNDQVFFNKKNIVKSTTHSSPTPNSYNGFPRYILLRLHNGCHENSSPILSYDILLAFTIKAFRYVISLIISYNMKLNPIFLTSDM